MKKIVCALFVFSFLLSAQAQYLPVVKQNRVWYSYYDGMTRGTDVLAVGPDTTYLGKTLPTLLRMDQNLKAIRKLGTLEEDTSQGLLRVEVFGVYSYEINFSASVGDSSLFGLLSGDSLYLRVSRKYNFVDFRNVTRRVLELQAPAQAFCPSRKITVIEGIGPLGSLVSPNHDCSVSDIPQHTLRCVFDGGEKIYGDTVQQCFVLSDEHHEINVISIFPNPAGDFLKVEAAKEMLGYEIITFSGAVVQSGEIQNALISIEALMPGTYFIRLQSALGYTYHQQILKL